jgi:hypothetical protein
MKNIKKNNTKQSEKLKNKKLPVIHALKNSRMLKVAGGAGKNAMTSMYACVTWAC